MVRAQRAWGSSSKVGAEAGEMMQGIGIAMKVWDHPRLATGRGVEV